MMAELMPCTLCGEPGRIYQTGQRIAVECQECFSRTPFLPTDTEVSIRWNKRTTGLKRGFLLPCPQCGGDPIERQPDGCLHWYVECSVCGFRTLARQTRDESIRKWNKRNG